MTNMLDGVISYLATGAGLTDTILREIWPYALGIIAVALIVALYPPLTTFVPGQM